MATTTDATGDSGRGVTPHTYSTSEDNKNGDDEDDEEREGGPPSDELTADGLNLPSYGSDCRPSTR